jgi:hypothetical protein
VFRTAGRLVVATDQSITRNESSGYSDVISKSLVINTRTRASWRLALHRIQISTDERRGGTTSFVLQVLSVELIRNSSLIGPETLNFAGSVCPVREAALTVTTPDSSELLVGVMAALGPLQHHTPEWSIFQSSPSPLNRDTG